MTDSILLDDDNFLNWAANSLVKDQCFQKWAISVGGVQASTKEQFIIVIRAFMKSIWAKDFNRALGTAVRVRNDERHVNNFIQKEAKAQRKHRLTLAKEHRNQMKLEIKLEKARLGREKQVLDLAACRMEHQRLIMKHEMGLRTLDMESQSNYQQFQTRQMRHREVMADKEIKWFRLNNSGAGMDVDDGVDGVDGGSRRSRRSRRS